MANDNGVLKPYSQEHILNQSFDRVLQQLMVESLGFDGQSLQRLNADNLATQLDYDGGTNPIYIGLAAPGALTSEAKWLIKKLTFDGSNNPTAIKFANGSSNFDQIWADRASITYI
jgi:hypothetical protein